MHEMSLCESIVQTLLEQAPVQHYWRVKTVRLELGTLAAVEISALEFCFEAACRGTLAEGSRLEIIPVAGAACCEQCGTEFELRELYQACPGCGGHQLRVLAGRELRIRELEVE